jgi:hypothetical protein
VVCLLFRALDVEKFDGDGWPQTSPDQKLCFSTRPLSNTCADHSSRYLDPSIFSYSPYNQHWSEGLTDVTSEGVGVKGANGGGGGGGGQRERRSTGAFDSAGGSYWQIWHAAESGAVEETEAASEETVRESMRMPDILR